MRELLRRLGQHSNITFQLLVSSLFISVLGLASAMYVMQVLRRYISYGVDATLITLTSGALIAVLFTYIFKVLRVRLAKGINHPAQDELEEKAFATLTRARSSALNMFDIGTQQEVMNGLKFIQQTYSPNQVISILDVPFSFLYLAAIYILSPVIAYIVMLFMVFMLIVNFFEQYHSKNESKELSSVSSKFSSLISSTIHSSDGIRAFNAKDVIMAKWKEELEVNQKLQDRLMVKQAKSSSFSQSVSSTLTIAVVCVGALQVVTYDLGIGTLIGANILSKKAFGPITGCVSTGIALNRSNYYMALLKKFFQIPMEPLDGATPTKYSGSLHFKNLSFSYMNASDMLFANLTASIPTGQFTVVVGNNGAGKTTMARMLVGILRPSKGQILIDGADLEQYQLSWWRQQVIYLPQEPTFFDGTLRENLSTLKPDISDDELRSIVEKVGLSEFLDQSKDGLDMKVRDNGKSLALGIRRRFALVRGMVNDSQVAILDEPTEGLDSEGQSAVLNIIKEFRSQNKTVFLFSSKPHQQHPNADMIINLNMHPVPGIKMKISGENKA